MSGAPLPPPDERAAALDYERWLTSLVEARQAPPARKAWWESGAVSGLLSGLLALATVIVTSVATYRMQIAQRSFESQTARRDTLLREERDFLTSVNDLLTQHLHAKQELLKIATGQSNYDSLPADQQIAMIVEANKIDDRWMSESERDAMLMDLYFSGPAGIPSLWDSTRERVRSFTLCVDSTLRSAQQRHRRQPNGCAQRDTAAGVSAGELKRALVQQVRKDFAQGRAAFDVKN